MLAEHPQLIWCTITGFGAESSRPGYDFVVQAESGWMSITGEPGGAPMKTGVALVDVITGKDAAIAILAALAGSRRGSAVERRLTVSLQHSAASALINVAQNSLVSGAEAGRWGNAHANLVPYELFEASDRALVIKPKATMRTLLRWRALLDWMCSTTSSFATTLLEFAPRGNRRRDPCASRRKTCRRMGRRWSNGSAPGRRSANRGGKRSPRSGKLR